MTTDASSTVSPQTSKAWPHALIDELSLGITLIPFEMRVGTELAHFLHSARTPNEVYPLTSLVWSKLVYVMGFMHPRGTPFDQATELTMQKMFFDDMWAISMLEMIYFIGDQMLPNPEHFSSLAQKLNQLNALHATELRTFPQTYDNEVHGILDAFNDVTIDIVSQMVSDEHGDRPPLTLEQRTEEGKQLHNLLFAAFEREATKDALPSLHILASLHSAVRWNKQQQLKANDYLDFQHATAALGYCDAFFNRAVFAINGHCQSHRPRPQVHVSCGCESRGCSRISARTEVPLDAQGAAPAVPLDQANQDAATERHP